AGSPARLHALYDRQSAAAHVGAARRPVGRVRAPAQAAAEGGHMKAIWSGTIGFGLVSIPVNLYSALEASEHVSFRQLHKKDRAPIRYKKVCSKEDVEVPNSEIVRAYQMAKGKWTIVEDEDVEEVREKTGKGSRTIDVLQFVPLEALNPLSFDHPYYVAPDD